MPQRSRAMEAASAEAAGSESPGGGAVREEARARAPRAMPRARAPKAASFARRGKSGSRRERAGSRGRAMEALYSGAEESRSRERERAGMKMIKSKTIKSGELIDLSEFDEERCGREKGSL